MDLSELLKPEFIKIDCEAKEKESVLKAIACLAKTSDVLASQSEEAIFRALRDREQLGTTGFGKGIAIPHCRLKDISDFVVGILIVHRGAEFEALDKKKVRLVFFIIAPEKRKSEHIHLLSSISRVLHKLQAVNEILLSVNAEEVKNKFIAYIKADVKIEQKLESCLINVFVQDEEKFNDILQIFSETDGCSVSVIDGNDASYYLGKIPLFASFWERKERGFHRVIKAVVSKNISNNILRQINLIDGTENKNSGFMVTMQDLSYVNGALYL